jgi:hypothetical protein
LFALRRWRARDIQTGICGCHVSWGGMPSERSDVGMCGKAPKS